jgi:hypothetical protein
MFVARWAIPVASELTTRSPRSSASASWTSADHDDAGGSIGQRDGSGRESSEHVDYRDRAGRPCSAIEEAVDETSM